MNDLATSGALPNLSPYEDVFWCAFGHLTTERGIGMAPGPIPFSSIITYIRFNRLSPLQGDVLMRVVREMDNAWLNAVARKRDESNK